MLTPLQQAKNLIVRRWGEMGGYWGISRTMAELYALLFVTPKPLCTDDVMDQLKISRGNASMSLRALVDWGLIERVHIFGDRKEYFRADTDVWRMFETITRERKRREVEPILTTLERCCEMVAPSRARGAAAPPAAVGPDAGGSIDDPKEVAEFQRRVEELQRFLKTMGTLFELVLQVGPQGMQGLAAAMTPPATRKPKKGRMPAKAG
jgi:DNA-binding transcriptional regulator GbsR (MarR family)